MTEQMLRQELLGELTERIIPFWARLRDDEHGGFYSRMSFDLQVDSTADKGCILNSRILWFFSESYRFLNDRKLLDLATHAFDFLVDHCLDPVNGGVYWSVNCKGQVLDGTKHTYNQAFAIYALSAYYRVSHNPRALLLALQLYELIETRCKDQYGYLEAFTVDFKPEQNDKLSENGVIAYRTMNTLLHVFEGYSGLYEVTKDACVGNSLLFISYIWATRIYNQRLTRQEVFFDRYYNSLIDLHSYGHDIETSWLVDTGMAPFEHMGIARQVYVASQHLASCVHDKAVHEGSVYNEKEHGTDDKTRVWWVQAEAMVGFYHAYRKEPQKVEYLQDVFDIWNYIKANIIDPRAGSEWFWEVDDNGEPSSRKDVVEPWKCPYHNGRMCITLLRRLYDL